MTWCRLTGGGLQLENVMQSGPLHIDKFNINRDPVVPVSERNEDH